MNQAIQGIILDDPHTKAVSSRSRALDALRGATVALMLLVNNAAMGEFTPLQLMHAPWGAGFTLADLVFPWFLFCAGASLPFVYSGFLKGNEKLSDWLMKNLTRAVPLFLIGVFLTSAVAHTPIMGLGVLQLIALATFCAALTMPLPSLARGFMALGLLLGYWAFLRFFSVGQLEAGTFEAGKNAAAQLNIWLAPLGLRGLPSVIPTTALVMLSTLISEMLKKSLDLPFLRIALRFFVVGTGLTLLGFLWDLDLEFNKTHWTPAYILVAAGLGTLLLLLFLALERTVFALSLAPLEVFGSNALLAYIAPILFKTWVLQDWKFGSSNLQDSALNALTTNGREIGGWAYTLLYLLACWLFLLFCQRKNWCLKL
jgi:predicted acyltransferase